MSKRLFVSTSFSTKVGDDGRVVPDFRKEVESLLAELRKSKELEVYCAIEDEGWVISDSPPDIGVAKDLQEIDNSDVVLALVSDQPSWGVQYEMGYATAKGKAVIAATPKDIRLAYFNTGLAQLKKIQHITYETFNDLAQQASDKLG